MIIIIATLASFTLAILSVLHLVWGFGVTWPEADSRALARRVAGFKGIDRMPRPAACFFVAAMLAFAALATLMAAGLAPTRYPEWIVLTAVSAVAAVFGLRGVLAYSPAWRARTPEEPFATLDRRFYGPLCLAISAALTFVVFA